MNIYNYEEAFGAADKTTPAMRRAITDWFGLYYNTAADDKTDPSQRIAYCVVNKLVKTVFGEYKVTANAPLEQLVVQALDKQKLRAVQLALVGGECYLKPWFAGGAPSFAVIPRNNVLIFGTDQEGNPTDMGTVERSIRGKYYYTLLERRSLDTKGRLVIQNKLYRALNSQNLGVRVPLTEVEEYAHLPEQFIYEAALGIGLVRVKNPMLNCVDGSADGVSVYAAAAGLIRAIDENEAQLRGEFRRGESRIILSGDMLDRDQKLSEHLFVGLDDDPQSVGITVFSPQLREQSYLNRKWEYLRNIESIIGLKRGTLSQVQQEEKTATEIASSAGDYNLTIIDFQKMWENALMEAVQLCGVLAGLHGYRFAAGQLPTVDWGNGILYDEDKTWADYLVMVDKGLLKPEYALAWRFNLPADSDVELFNIRKKYMPEM